MFAIGIRIALIFVAIACFYIAYKLILKSFPELITPEKVNTIENALKFSSVEIAQTRIRSKSQAAIFLGRILLHLNVFSYLVSKEHLGNIRRAATNSIAQIDQKIKTDSYEFCANLFSRAKLDLENLAQQTTAELNTLHSLKKIKAIQKTLTEWLGLVDGVEAKGRETDRALSELSRNRNEDVVLATSSLRESFDGIVRELNQTRLADLDQLIKISESLDSLFSIAEELLYEAPATFTETWIDYYQLLGIDSTASAKEIKKACRKKLKECHPDLMAADIENITNAGVKEEVWRVYNQKTTVMLQAKEILGRPDTKDQYDTEYRRRKGGV